MSKDYRTQGAFWKAFQKAVPNFDETKLWLEKKSRDLFICFVDSGRLKRCNVGKSDYYIDLWKQHFIEFIDTGHFDWYSYNIVYDNKNINPDDIGRVWRFPLINKFGEDTYALTDELFTFLSQYRRKYKDCGMKQVGKPKDWKGEGIYSINEKLF